MNTPFVMHVGFSKTGTTTLQNHLFAKHSQIQYLGKPYRDDHLKAALHRLMMEDSIAYQASVDGVFLATLVKSELANMAQPKRVLVLSDEMFVSYTKVRDKGVIARRIQEVLGPEKVIITIRHQMELLKSAYLSRGRLLFNVPPRFSGLAVTFEQWLTLGYEHFHRGYLEHANFAKTIDWYVHLFGKENVCVLLLEELIHNKTGHLERLSNFLGIDTVESMACVADAHEHQEVSQAVLDWEALNTHLFPFNRWFLMRGALRLAAAAKKKLHKEKPANVTISATWQKRLTDMYREGNQHLVQEYQLPLAQYGYPL